MAAPEKEHGVFFCFGCLFLLVSFCVTPHPPPNSPPPFLPSRAFYLLSPDRLGCSCCCAQVNIPSLTRPLPCRTPRAVQLSQLQSLEPTVHLAIMTVINGQIIIKRMIFRGNKQKKAICYCASSRSGGTQGDE